MHLVSNFHDYYDTARAWHSPEPVYVRETREIRSRDLGSKVLAIWRAQPYLGSGSPLRRDKTLEIGYKFLVGFCGRVYPGYQTEVGPVYSSQRLDELLKHRARHADDAVLALRKKCNRRRHYGTPRLTHAHWDRFVDEHDFDVGPEPFRAVGAPVFLLRQIPPWYSQTEACANPQLKSYGFASRADPFTAFQEIEMYLGGVLVSQMDPNIERSDELIRDSKGFDEWSFRQKGPKKRKRK